MTVMVSVWRLIASHSPASATPVIYSPAPASLDEASRNLPSGAYTTLRTYSHKNAIRLREHLTRLRESAKLKGYDIVIDENRIREAIRWVLRQEEVEQENRLRLTMDLSQEPGSVYLSIEKLHVPPILAYEEGVRVVTCDLHRVQPLAKLTDFIAPASDYRQALAVGINEALMVNSKGEILEGLSSNFFAIRASTLITADEEVLAGITRALVIDAARQVNLPIEYRAVQLGEIPQIDEAFITSASRGILPVCKIDHSLIGNGHPGVITKTLSAAFDRLIADEQELI